MDVTEAAALVAPAYDDGASQESICARWLEHYNELHQRRPG
jgi:hypothetical protein